MRVLALDIATRTGWAYGSGGRPVSGVEYFAEGCPKGGETIRHPHILNRAFHFLSELMDRAEPDVVIIESGIQRGTADKILQRLIGIGMLAAQQSNAAVLTVSSGTWRKEIHGSGGLGTDAAKDAATTRTGIADDNEAEAVCILEYALRRAVQSAPNTAPRRAA